MDDIRKLTGVVIDPGHGGTDSGATGNDMLGKKLHTINFWIYVW